ncbi:hypothetical protein Agub_g11747, partial [Astrephomene gubernaculifera]
MSYEAVSSIAVQYTLGPSSSSSSSSSSSYAASPPTAAAITLGSTATAPPPSPLALPLAPPLVLGPLDGTYLDPNATTHGATASAGIASYVSSSAGWQSLQLDVAGGEVVVEVAGCRGALLEQIVFRTSFGRNWSTAVGPGLGCSLPYRYLAPPGGYLVALQVYAGNYVEEVGLVWGTPLPTMEVPGGNGTPVPQHAGQDSTASGGDATVRRTTSRSVVLGVSVTVPVVLAVLAGAAAVFVVWQRRRGADGGVGGGGKGEVKGVSLIPLASTAGAAPAPDGAMGWKAGGGGGGGGGDEEGSGVDDSGGNGARSDLSSVVVEGASSDGRCTGPSPPAEEAGKESVPAAAAAPTAGAAPSSVNGECTAVPCEALGSPVPMGNNNNNSSSNNANCCDSSASGVASTAAAAAAQHHHQQQQQHHHQQQQQILRAATAAATIQQQPPGQQQQPPAEACGGSLGSPYVHQLTAVHVGGTAAAPRPLRPVLYGSMGSTAADPVAAAAALLVPLAGGAAAAAGAAGGCDVGGAEGADAWAQSLHAALFHRVLYQWQPPVLSGLPPTATTPGLTSLTSASSSSSPAPPPAGSSSASASTASAAAATAAAAAASRLAASGTAPGSAVSLPKRPAAAAAATTASVSSSAASNSQTPSSVSALPASSAAAATAAAAEGSGSGALFAAAVPPTAPATAAVTAAAAAAGHTIRAVSGCDALITLPPPPPPSMQPSPKSSTHSASDALAALQAGGRAAAAAAAAGTRRSEVVGSSSSSATAPPGTASSRTTTGGGAAPAQAVQVSWTWAAAVMAGTGAGAATAAGAAAAGIAAGAATVAAAAGEATAATATDVVTTSHHHQHQQQQQHHHAAVLPLAAYPGLHLGDVAAAAAAPHPYLPPQAGAGCCCPADLDNACNDSGGGSNGPTTELLLGRDVVVDAEDPGSYLGHGTSGVVRRGLLRQSDGSWLPVAVKLLNQPNDQAVDTYRKHLRTLLQEMTILGSLRHPNVVRLLGGSVSLLSGASFLVEELCGRTLSHAIYDESTPYSLQLVLKWCIDVARGLSYLHPNIMHRDLKPSNVLLDSYGTAKISDFGLARFKLHTTLVTRDAEVGTTCYMSPECFVSNDFKVTAACDVYSLGVMMNEMVTRCRPWSGVRTAVVGFKVAVVGDRPRLPPPDCPLCPPGLRQLIQDCWAQQPEERPSSAEVLSRLEELL